MRRSAYFPLLVGFICLVNPAAHVALAQAPTGNLTGTVLDQSGALIPGTDVSLIHEGTDVRRYSTTDDVGFFSISAIPAGSYTLEIGMPGFAFWRRTGIAIRIGDKIHLSDIVLEIAVTQDQITVSVAPESIVIDGGEKAELITDKQIQDLSIVGRSAVELLKILPGVVYTGEDIPGQVVQFNRGLGNYHVGGTRNTQVAILSDGADVIDPGCNCGAAVTPNVELVAEVKVQTASFGAENGKGPVVFQTVSKAGTSEFHGEAYLYWRHHRFNSQDWRANAFGEAKPRDSYYFPGFNIGGPLTKGRDRAFFFAGVEVMRQNLDLGVIPANVPTERMRQGDFSEVVEGYPWIGNWITGVPTDKFWGNWTDWGFGGISEDGIIDSGLIDPGGRVLMNLYPFPNRDPAANNGYNYVSNILNPQHRHQELVRIDFSVSDTTRLYTRFNHEFQASNYPYLLWADPFPDLVPYPSNMKGDYETWSTSTSLVHLLNPATTNEVVFAATYWGMPNTFENPTAFFREALGYPYRGLFNNTHTDMLPGLWGLFGVANLFQYGGTIDPGLFGNKWLISIEDNFSKVLDTHTLKIGAGWQLTTNDQPGARPDQGVAMAATWSGHSTGNAYADLLLGRVGYYSESTKNVISNTRWRWFSAYIQDSWKATRKLTLEFGIRLVHPGRTYDTGGRMAGFDPSRYDPDSPISEYSGVVAVYRGDDVPRSILKTPTLVACPRLGFAYDLSGSGRTVIRGGAGAFSYHGRGGDYFGAVFNPPLVQNVELFPYPLTLAGIDQIDPFTQLQPSTLRVLEPFNNKTPSTYSFSLTLSQRLPADLFWETSYVGSVSHHQLVPQSSISGPDLNAVPEGAMFGFPAGTDGNAYRPYLSHGTIKVKTNAISQNYHSLQLTLNRQSGRFNFAGAYTFSKVMGIGGDSFATLNNAFEFRNRNYGPLGYDRTHAVSVSYNYSIPDLVQSPGLRSLLNGWQITGISQFQSGAPIRSVGLTGTMAEGVLLPNGETSYQLLSEYIAGTPDTTVQPFLTCNPGVGLSSGQYANPLCFSAPLPERNGHYAFPYMKGPGFQNHDLSIFKNLPLGGGEDRKLQVRFSAFNFLNHPIPFISPDRDLALNYEFGALSESSLEQFGRASLKRGRRLFQFAVKFIF